MKALVSYAPAAVTFALLSLVAARPAESAATDPGVRAASGTDTFGNPLPGLTPDQSTLFFEGQVAFAKPELVADGLGPRFNLDVCVGCHSFPTHGGS